MAQQTDGSLQNTTSVTTEQTNPKLDRLLSVSITTAQAAWLQKVARPTHTMVTSPSIALLFDICSAKTAQID
jgi:hypothetical protein